MFLFFFFNDTATTEIYTLSLHDALPIFAQRAQQTVRRRPSISATTLVFGWTERCKSHKTVLPGWPSSDNHQRRAPPSPAPPLLQSMPALSLSFSLAA